jgi:hypothetical protein
MVSDMPWGWWYRLRKRSQMVRKAAALTGQLPRALRRITARPAAYRFHPPILANSFPKSGTHLLVQLLEALPGVRDFGTFIASQPTVTFRERSHAQHLRKLRRLVPGELAGAHLFHDPAYAAALRERNVRHVFLYRDLRDVAVSEAYYLASMNRWHRMHSYFARLPSMAERISLAIEGDGAVPYDYPDIGARFARYAGWLAEPDVLGIRFEDLVSDAREATLRRIVMHCRPGTGEAEAGELARRLEGAVNPDRSHTFREGRAGTWREALTPAQRAAVKRVAGERLVALGYEPGLDW